MKMTFIAWERYERRSDLLAHHLGASMHHIYHGRRGSILHAPGRYLSQGRETWSVLTQERPDVVLVQNPPIFCALLACLYARRHRVRFVIDSHTAAFTSRKWAWSLGLHRMLSRCAAATIVHNHAQAKIVGKWGCPFCVMGFIPGDYPVGEPYPFDGRFRVAVVNTFSEDEPLDAVLAAAAGLPGVEFCVTGDERRAAPRLLAVKPDNCSFTGYLPYDRYVSLLRGSDFVMDLTTRDNCLLAGAFEAVCIGTPLIVSDWPTLRNYFPLGTVYVANSAEAIRAGVERAQRDQPALRAEFRRLQEQLHADWQESFQALCRLLGPPPGAADRGAERRA